MNSNDAREHAVQDVVTAMELFAGEEFDPAEARRLIEASITRYEHYRALGNDDAQKLPPSSWLGPPEDEDE